MLRQQDHYDAAGQAYDSVALLNRMAIVRGSAMK